MVKLKGSLKFGKKLKAMAARKTLKNKSLLTSEAVALKENEKQLKNVTKLMESNCDGVFFY